MSLLVPYTRVVKDSDLAFFLSTAQLPVESALCCTFMKSRVKHTVTVQACGSVVDFLHRLGFCFMFRGRIGLSIRKLRTSWIAWWVVSSQSQFPLFLFRLVGTWVGTTHRTKYVVFLPLRFYLRGKSRKTRVFWWLVNTGANISGHVHGRFSSFSFIDELLHCSRGLFFFSTCYTKFPPDVKIH